MKNWEHFENQCLEYLNDNFKQYANFDLIGGSDSTSSDIHVITKTNDEFFIEVKKSPAQCGQFVLLTNNNTQQFEYSHLNKSFLNTYSKSIMEYMNKHFEKFSNAGTSGTNIVFNNSDNIYKSWITEHYKQKQTKLIITNDFVILPIDEVGNAFDIIATYRIKKSGSSPVGIGAKDDVINIISNMKLTKYRYLYNNGNLIIFTDKEIDKITFKCNSNTYMFSKRVNNYEVRKLSNTYNANVIFSITLKKNYVGLSNQDLINKFFSK